MERIKYEICGKSIDIKKIKKEEYLKKHLEYKYFYYLEQDREAGIRFYSLKDKL